MRKKVKAVRPYIYKGGINFKYKPYEAWVRTGGESARALFPPRWLHGLAHRVELPRLWEDKGCAMLMFVQPYSMRFDMFPYYMTHEVIPFFWDCWPESFEKVFSWLEKHRIKTAIFTSSQFADMVRERFPMMNVLWCPEGIDAGSYKEGKELRERGIDFLQYGREIDSTVKYDFTGVNYVSAKRDGKAIFSQKELVNALTDAKIVAAYPKSWTNPEEAGGIETLTQRYWECMLSRCIMVGHAPKELVDLIGYNPVIELDSNDPNGQLRKLLENIADYQALVDKNREMAIKYGDWKESMGRVKEFLEKCGYSVRLSTKFDYIKTIYKQYR